MTKIDQELGARLRAARIRAGLTQTVLSVRAGIALGTLQRAETFGAISTRTLAGIARALGTSPDDLRGRRTAPEGER